MLYWLLLSLTFSFNSYEFRHTAEKCDSYYESCTNGRFTLKKLGTHQEGIEKILTNLCGVSIIIIYFVGILKIV